MRQEVESRTEQDQEILEKIKEKIEGKPVDSPEFLALRDLVCLERARSYRGSLLQRLGKIKEKPGFTIQNLLNLESELRATEVQEGIMAATIEKNRFGIPGYHRIYGFYYNCLLQLGNISPLEYILKVALVGLDLISNPPK